MLFFNFPIPNFFNFGESVRQKYNAHYERKIGLDSRNSALLEPLEMNLFKLEDIRVRIGTRIDKETASGTDMTNALNLLSSADYILSYAEKAVAVATSTVDSVDPHPAYMETQDAYVALNQTRDSLELVLKAIELAVSQSSTTPSSN